MPSELPEPAREITDRFPYKALHGGTFKLADLELVCASAASRPGMRISVIP